LRARRGDDAADSKERMAQAAALDDAAYFRDFGLTPQRLKLAAPSVLVMHPGPMNRGVEMHPKWPTDHAPSFANR